MPTPENREPWRKFARQAEGICEAARHDPYEPRLAEEMQALGAELAALNAGETASSAALDADDREQRAATYTAAGEAWFALNDNEQALTHFDVALAMLGAIGYQSFGVKTVAAQAQCGRGKCLVALQRYAEAIPMLQASIDWSRMNGDSTTEALQSLLSQAMHTLGLADAAMGNFDRALEATVAAVELRRRLAAQDVECYRLALSRSLRNLGDWLNELDRREDALQFRREMLKLRREQWQRKPSVAATLALAQALDILVRELVECNRDFEDVPALATESAALYLDLARTYPKCFAWMFVRQVDFLVASAGLLVNTEKHERGLSVAATVLSLSRQYWAELGVFAPEVASRANIGKSLRDLSTALRLAGCNEEALPPAQAAVTIDTEIAKSNPVVGLPSLAESLVALCQALTTSGCHPEGARRAAAAVEMMRDLHSAGRKTFAPGLAEVFSEICMSLGYLGDYPAALLSGRHAVQLYQKAAELDPDAYLHALAVSTLNLGVALSLLNEKANALEATRAAVALFRELATANRANHVVDLMNGLERLAHRLQVLECYAEELEARREAVALMRELARRNRAHFLPDLARGVGNMAVAFAKLGLTQDGATCAEESVLLYRELVATGSTEHARGLVSILRNLGVLYWQLDRNTDALRAALESASVGSTAPNRRELLPEVAGSLADAALMLNKFGRRAEAIDVQKQEIEVYRELVEIDRRCHLAGLANCLSVLSDRLADRGHYVEALSASQEAVDLWGELGSANERLSSIRIAATWRTLSRCRERLGQYAEGLRAVSKAVDLMRKLAIADQAGLHSCHAGSEPTLSESVVTSQLATSLLVLGEMFSKLGRYNDALAASVEATELFRGLVRTNPQTWTANLADSLTNLGAMYLHSDAAIFAVATLQEAMQLHRVLHGDDRRTSGLPRVLSNLGEALSNLGSHDEALAAAEEAVQLFRSLASANRQAFVPELAVSLGNLGLRQGAVGQLKKALEATQEALDLLGAFARTNSGAIVAPEFARLLNNLGNWLRDLGRHEEALAAYRECGVRVLSLCPDDPYLWTRLCRGAFCHLATPADLRDFHLPLLRLLTEHRELAWDSEHARVFLELQAEVAAHVWELLARLPSNHGELLDDAIAALAATLHSPDLARWLAARSTGEGPLARLAELKRDLIEAEQLLAAMRKGPGGDNGSGLRVGLSGAGTEERSAALTDDLERQSAKAWSLRQAFRDERARLVAEDPRFAAAFEPLGAQALHSIAGHADGSALLCVLELMIHAGEEPRIEHGRTVVALVHADDRRTQLLELPGVSELAWHARRYAPELGERCLGALRGAPLAAVRAPYVNGTASVPDFAERMSSVFWAPLQQLLQESGAAIQRLHVCLNGITQQLPLGLRQSSDCPGPRVVTWPGLPYLRRAAIAASSLRADGNTKQSFAPWLVGHDCAWNSPHPLPMVAVEAALLRDLLLCHSQSMQSIQHAVQLHCQVSALVACCHGGAEQAQFDHALYLGTEPLTVRKILQENIGPTLALLPACHAGRTDEDAAGNALGVAAAFMLCGTKVVVASSKVVPDLLIPWFTTLLSWHILHDGMGLYEAATAARRECGACEFPESYRQWLTGALPEALAVLQPGGAEQYGIETARMELAKTHGDHVTAEDVLASLCDHWPWQGHVFNLFSADLQKRQEATKGVASNVLCLREDRADDIRRQMREMAAFIFVYGIG